MHQVQHQKQRYTQLHRPKKNIWCHTPQPYLPLGNDRRGEKSRHIPADHATFANYAQTVGLGDDAAGAYVLPADYFSDYFSDIWRLATGDSKRGPDDKIYPAAV